MKKHYQTETGLNGNCWQAAVASVLGMDDINDVPHFMNLSPEMNRWETYVQFMRGAGIYVLCIPIVGKHHLSEVCKYNRFAEGDVLLKVEGKHEGIGHAVVGYFNHGKIKIVHDPNRENKDRPQDSYKIVGIDFLIADEGGAGLLEVGGKT